MNIFLDNLDSYMREKYPFCYRSGVIATSQPPIIEYKITRNPSAYWDPKKDIPFNLEVSKFKGSDNLAKIIFEDGDDTLFRRTFLIKLDTGVFRDVTHRIQPKRSWGDVKEEYLKIIKDIRFFGTCNAAKFILDLNE